MIKYCYVTVSARDTRFISKYYFSSKLTLKNRIHLKQKKIAKFIEYKTGPHHIDHKFQSMTKIIYKRAQF